MKKIIIFTLVLLFTFSFVGVSFAENTVQVSLSDNYIGRSPEYKITLYVKSALKRGDTISVTFDDSIPIERSTDRLEEITVNGIKVLETPKLQGRRIGIIAPINVEKGSKLEVVFPKGVLYNPNSPGYFALTVEIDGNKYKSDYYHITDASTVRDVTFSQADDGIEIDFTTGFDGNLKGNTSKLFRSKWFTVSVPVPQDFIFIRFSHILSETFNSISKNDITINMYHPPLNPDVKIHFEDTGEEEKEIAVCIPRNINANSSVKVLIKGISVPDEEKGVLYVKVWTSKEFTPIQSNEINVKGEYFIKTSYTISPDTPDGENGFYKTSPQISFSVDKGAGIENGSVFYSFDGKNFTLYSTPLRIEDGNKTLYYYSMGYAGKRKFIEKVQNLGFAVDSKPPKITVASNLSSDTPIYDLKITFSDKNFDYAVIMLHGISFTATDESFDIPVYLFDKATPFTIKAFDKAGNFSQFSGTISLKG